MAGPGAAVQAIVVGLQDFQESDRIVRLLTPGQGRVDVLARRARGSKVRFSGLDLGNKVEVVLREGRGDLGHIDSALLLDGRIGARADYDRLVLLAYCCEVCGGLARRHHAEPRLYGLLDMALVLLDAMTGPPGALFRIGFEGKALTFAGVAPVLDRCVACGEELEAIVHVSSVAGGAVHVRCGVGAVASREWLAAVEAARRTPLRELVDSQPPEGPQWALADAVEAHMGRGLASRAVLTQP